MIRLGIRYMNKIEDNNWEALKKDLNFFTQDVMGEREIMNEWEATKRKRLLKPIDFDNKYWVGGGRGYRGRSYIHSTVIKWTFFVKNFFRIYTLNIYQLLNIIHTKIIHSCSKSMNIFYENIDSATKIHMCVYIYNSRKSRSNYMTYTYTQNHMDGLLVGETKALPTCMG